MQFLQKRFNLTLLLLSFLIAVGTTLYYKNICYTGACSYRLIIDVISPIEMGAYIITIICLLFIFLPARYFSSWFKYIFSWGFPLSIVLVETLHSETDWLVISKTDIVRLMGMVFGVITIIFIVVRRFWYKK